MGARKSIVPFLHYKTENAVQSTQFDLSKLRHSCYRRILEKTGYFKEEQKWIT